MWRLPQDIESREVDDNLFVIQVYCLRVRDWKRVMYRGPWIFVMRWRREERRGEEREEKHAIDLRPAVARASTPFASEKNRPPINNIAYKYD